MKRSLLVVAGISIVALLSGCAPEEGSNDDSLIADDEGDITATSEEELQGQCYATAMWQTKVRPSASTAGVAITTLQTGTKIKSDCGGVPGGHYYNACNVTDAYYWLKVYGNTYTGFVASACVKYSN